MAASIPESRYFARYWQSQKPRCWSRMIAPMLMGGLTEGFETILALVAFCLWPQHFAVLAYIFAAACWITAITRIVAGYRTLRKGAADNV